MAIKDENDNKRTADEEAEKYVEESLRPIKERYRETYEQERRLRDEVEHLRRIHSGNQSTNASRADSESCTACNGTGNRECVQCEGRGWFYNRRLGIRESCHDCKQLGYLKCRSCDGRGYR